jgi:Transposase IS116/IS110/IS902 family./Transposase.
MAEVESVKQEPQFAAFIGIDWADQKHVWCMQAVGSEKRESGELVHTPEAVEAWVGQLCQRFANRPIAVAVEQTRGALAFMLSKYEPLHLFPVPSTMAANMRKALYPSGSKDDPRDADLLLDLLLQHRDKLRRLSPDTEATRRVQNLVEERRKLVDEKTAQSNRLTSHLKIYFPQMLDWFEHLDTELVCALLERWPTLEELQKVPPAKLRTFFCKHHCRDQELIERRMLAIRQAMPAIGDRAVIEAKSMVVKVSVQLIRSLLEGIADLDEKIEEAAAVHPDFFIFDSLPGAGAVMAPRLLAAFGSQRERYGSADEVQTYTGIAPVMESSGKKQWVHFRWAAPKFLRQSFHEWAGHSIAHSVWARSYYQQQRSKGNGHHAAVRALAFKWIRIVFRCWKDAVAYDESKYLAALARRGSPLLTINVAAVGKAL